MRLITKRICEAFRVGVSLRIDNSYTDGTSLFLFGNKIAEYRNNGLWITNAGWQSRTTMERLNGIAGVMVIQRNHQWYLNGEAWDGNWIHVSSMRQEVMPSESNEDEYVDFDMTFEWISREGYSKPCYAVFHTTNQSELDPVEKALNDNGIKTRRAESDTNGVYKINYFIVVLPTDYKKSLSLTKKANSYEHLQD